MSKHLGLLTILIALWSQSSFANVAGTDLQNFNPTSNGLDFVTVHSSDVLEPGTFNIGTFFNYSTNALPYFTLTSQPSNQKFFEPNDKVTGNDIHIGYGIMKGWDIGVSAASLLSQDVDNNTFLGTFARTGLVDIRLNTKVRLFRGNHKGMDTGVALVASADFDRVVNNPFAGDNAGPTINAEFVWDSYLTDWIRWGLNVGYRLRNQGTAIPNTGVTPIGDQVTYSTAAAFIFNDLAIMAELYGSSPTEDVTTPTDRKMSNLQTSGGVRWRYRSNLDFHAGVGTELFHGLGSPDTLIYAGVNWRIETRGDDVIGDEDQDGVLDDKDQCPGTPRGAAVNDLGCQPKRVKDITLRDINFEINTATLTPESATRVDGLIQQLKSQIQDSTKIVVEGHTDNTGESSYNMGLSRRRAQTIADLLVAKVPLKKNQVVVQGQGEENPLTTNRTKVGRAKNRRVELRVIH